MSLLLIIVVINPSENAASNDEISKVSISQSRGFSYVHPDFFAVYEDEKSLRIFESVISNAEQQPGIVDMSVPIFDFEITFNDGGKAGYHLWLTEDDTNGVIMDITNTHVIYLIPEKTTSLLIDLVI